MTVLAGADLGGSGARARIAEHGTVLGEAAGAGGAVRPGRALHAASSIAAIVREALGAAGRLRADVLVVGAAGAGRDPERSELEAALRRERLADHVRVTTDVSLMLADAFGDAAGIVVNSGTGSMAVGRLPDGRLVRSGGYGWQMGDEGSGYAIGRAALAAVSRALDGRGASSCLVERVQAAARAGTTDDLVRWAATASPAEVAGLARVVLEAEAAGDDAAHGIADFAARELAKLALSLVPAFAGRIPVPLALAGSLLGSDSGLRARVVARLEEEEGAVQVRTEVPDALRGALWLAGETIGR